MSCDECLFAGDSHGDLLEGRPVLSQRQWTTVGGDLIKILIDSAKKRAQLIALAVSEVRYCSERWGVPMSVSIAGAIMQSD